MDQPHDGQLLADVAANSSQRSFEELVRRHGEMVYHECRRLLAHAHDAEDAAQAVFLVLWKKAVSLRAKPTVADWLHRVARNICRNAQRARTVRQLHERRAAEQKSGLSEPGGSRNEILDVLDEHLDRLPEKYRLPLILFHLEGRSVEEIAALLSTNVSKITTRLNRGREALRSRIARRGMVVSSGMLMAALGSEAGAALPEAFAVQTAKSASLFATGALTSGAGTAGGSLSVQSAALANGALHMLSAAKLKIVAAIVVGAFSVGGGTIAVMAVSRAGATPPEQPLVKLDVEGTQRGTQTGIERQRDAANPVEKRKPWRPPVVATRPPVVPMSPELLTQLRTIKEGYLANRNAFTSGKCRFEYSIWSADSEEDALAGKKNDRHPLLSVEGRLVFKEDMLALSMKDNDPAAKDRDIFAPSISLQYVVQKGGYTIDAIGFGIAYVYPPWRNNSHIRFHPFHLAVDGGFNPGLSIIYAEEHGFARAHFSVETNVEREGRRWTRLIDKAEYGSHDKEYYFDPERGYLPFITEMPSKTAGGTNFRMRILDVQKIGENYFPLHAIETSQVHPKDALPYVEVREMKVLELDLKNPTTDDDLTSQIPRQTQYSDGIHANSACTLFRKGPGDYQTVSVHEVEGIYWRLMRIMEENRVPGIAICTRRCFGWMMPSIDNLEWEANVSYGQFFGQTEPGQSVVLATNRKVQQELGITEEQKQNLWSDVTARGYEYKERAKEEGLIFIQVEELAKLPLADRPKRIRELDSGMRDLEARLVPELWESVKTIFTDAQRARLEEIRRQLLGSRVLSEPAIVQALSLTAEQQQRIAAINDGYFDALVEFFAKEFDIGNGDYTELMAKMQKMAERRNAEADTVLTQPQREKLTELRGKPFDPEERAQIIQPPAKPAKK